MQYRNQIFFCRELIITITVITIIVVVVVVVVVVNIRICSNNPKGYYFYSP